MTRSGKTTLARVLIGRTRYPRIVVYDTKGTINWPGFRIERTLRAVTRSPADRITYRPVLDELDSPKFWNAFFKFCYLHKNLLVYVDEVLAITEGQEIPRYYRAILTRGGELGVSVWSGVQRPIYVPNFIFSESEHKYIFKLQMQGDREKAEAFTGVEAESIDALKRHQFYYANLDGQSGPYRLKFSGG
jgi:hypothetical protein